MATKNLNLGTVPVSRGEFDSTTIYYKDNIVQYKRGSYQVISESPIVGVPPINDEDIVNNGWIIFAGTLSEASLIKSNTQDLSGNNVQENLNSAAEKLKELKLESIYDVSAHNNGAVFESLSALLSSTDLSTLIPTSVRHGGMTIRFIQDSEQSPDNKYVQYRLMSATFSTIESNWQGVDSEPTAGSENLVKSGGLYPMYKKGNFVIHDFYTWEDTSAVQYITSGNTLAEGTNLNMNQLVLDCAEGDTFEIYGYGGIDQRLYAFIDANNNILEKATSMQNATDVPIVVTAPENAIKIIILGQWSYRSKFSICKNGEFIKLMKSTKQDISNLNSRVTALETSDSQSYDVVPFLETEGFISVNNEGNFTPYSGYTSTDFIQVERNKVYYYKGSIIYDCCYIAFYNANQEYISSLPGTSSPDIRYNYGTFYYPATFPEGTKYIRFSGLKDNFATSLIPFVAKGNPNAAIWQDSKRLFEKTICFVGDSVMKGQDTKEPIRSIPYFLTNKYKLSCVNKAVGGAILTSSTSHYAPIYQQLTGLPKNAEIIIMQGGLNGIEVEPTQDKPWGWGTISQDFTGTLDTVLQLPCLEAMCKYVVTTYPDKKYGFIINYDIGSYEYWQQKAALIRQVLDKWGIPYIDLRHSGVNLASPDIREKYGIDAYTLYPLYSDQETYNIDDRVCYDNKVYKANQNISTPEEWTSSHWDLVSSTRYDSWHCNAVAYEHLADMIYSWIKTL